MAAAPQILNYATHRRTRWRNHICIAILLLLSGYLLNRYAGPVRRHLTLLVDQRTCMSYAPSPDEIVASGDESASLTGPPKCFTSVNDELARTNPNLTTPSWPAKGMGGWHLLEESALVFLGELRNCNGSRLVVVKLAWAADTSVPITGPGQDFQDELRLYAWVLQPATLLGPPRCLNTDCFPAAFSKPSCSDAKSGTIYAAQKDQQDPRRVTIRYNYDGHPALITATLGDDEHLHFSQVSGPRISAWDPQFMRSTVLANPH